VKYVNYLKKNHALGYDRESDLIQPAERHRGPERESPTARRSCARASASTRCGPLNTPRSATRARSSRRAAWVRWGFGAARVHRAQLARKDRVVIDVDGDGSLRMNLGELETATTYDIPVKVLLLNNLGDGMVRQWQTMYFGTRFSGTDKSLHKKDFVKAAEADGFGFSKRLTDKAELRQVLKAFVKFDGPRSSRS